MPVKKFMYVEHTADIAFVAYGKTLEEAIENSVLAMIGVMFDIDGIKSSKSRIMEVELRDSAGNIEDLVWFALQSILTKVQVGNLAPIKFDIEELSEGRQCAIKGVLRYKDIGAVEHGLLEVKAVTPHGLEVKRTKTGYSIRAVIDI